MAGERTIPNALIIGCGHIGHRVGAALAKMGQSVTGVARSDEKLVSMRRLGITPFQASLDDPGELANLPTKDTQIYYFAPPPGGGHVDPRMQRFCRQLDADHSPRKMVVISTSAVYGDCGGEVVDETRPPAPISARGKRRLHAEEEALACGTRLGFPVVILRVTGIYSARRLPVQRVRESQPVLRPEEASFTNRIHAADLARVCIAAMKRGVGGEIYNVSDGQQSTMTDYFNAIADAFGLPHPPQVTLAEAKEVMSPLMLSYVQESRRLDNRKMLRDLGIKLRYPTLADGLRTVNLKQT